MRNPILWLLCVATLSPIYSKSYVGSAYGITTLTEALDHGIINTKQVRITKLAVKGVFIIDKDFAFYATEIDMDPNSLTLIKPGVNASFYDSHIFCSKGMWAGISTYGSITVSECFIEDAQVGINVLPGGQANIRKTDFKNNIVGAECRADGFISVDQCRFFAEINGLHSPHPAVYNTSYIGIYVHECSSDFNILSNNYFNAVQNGIVIENSSTYSDVNDNNIYENIYPNSEFANEKFGNAIRIVNSSLTQKGASINKKYSNTGALNYDYNFKNCKVGIYSDNSYLNVSEDDFFNCVYSIYITNSSNINEIIIKSNRIRESATGIYLKENKSPIGPKGKILSNDIILPYKPESFGIKFENSSNISSVLQITSNNINVQSSNSAGIVLSRVSYLSLYKNNINILGTFSSYACIDITNCTGTIVSSNNLKGSSVLYKIPQDADKVGIRIRDSEQSNIGCNTIESCPVDLQCIGECDLSLIHGNTFKNSAVGLMIGNGNQLDGSIGHQVGMKNEWIGIFTKYKAWYSVNTGNPFNITNSYFYVDFSIPLYNPTNQYKSEVPGEPWFYNSKDSDKPACDVLLNKKEKQEKEKDYSTLKMIMDMIFRSIIINQPIKRTEIWQK